MPILTDNLLSAWEFEDDLTDSHGSNDLSAGAGSASYAAATGDVGKGVQFDGTFYGTKSSPSILSPTDTITVGVVAKIPTLSAITNLIDRLGGSDGFWIRLTATGLVNWALNGGSVIAASSGEVDSNSLVFIMCTYDKDAGGSDEAKIYIDNSQDGSGDYSTALDYNPEPDLYVGSENGANVAPSGLIIYQLAVWSSVLSSSLRSQWYNSGTGLAYPRWSGMQATLTITGAMTGDISAVKYPVFSSAITRTKFASKATGE